MKNDYIVFIFDNTMFRTILLTSCILYILNVEGTRIEEGDPDTPNNKVSITPTPPSMPSVPWVASTPAPKECLTGYMTDVQNWVDKDGRLKPDLDYRCIIDVSSRQNPISTLQKEIISASHKSKAQQVKYLSMSNCNLKWVPTVFNLTDLNGRALHSTVEYLTLYGNDFATVSSAGDVFYERMNASSALQFSDVSIRWPGPTIWATGLNEVIFQRLQQLDLRKCNIQHLTDDLFANMPRLEALYLGENQISFISTNAFRGLSSLIHLDLSRNFDGSINNKGVVFEHTNVFHDLKKMRSLDMSMTVMTNDDINIFKTFNNLTRLSICYAGLSHLPEDFFNGSYIRHLDVSGNLDIISKPKSLRGLRNTLQVLYAKDVGLNDFETFYNFAKLEILDLEDNEINGVSRFVSKSLKSLQILNLKNNKLIAWSNITFKYMKQLEFLSLSHNNINIISKFMIHDFKDITYLGLSLNFFVCTCHVRELFEIAYHNEDKTKPWEPRVVEREPFSFHRGFEDFTTIIRRRKNVEKSRESNEDIESEGNFLLVDYDEDSYRCLQVEEAKIVCPSEVNTCLYSKKEPGYTDVIQESRLKLLALITIPVIVFPTLIFLYIFRRNLKYFCIAVRNLATLSMINNNDVVDDGTIFHYDVFVSYCNDDRDWVLDYLLPNVEKECNISVCLHERDFQVGLSILENIVSCMDRSRSIMLVISKQFLLSQWCQFEMHLAQHRLLETRREDLILVLLEEIPRSLRPTTLHYLMLTKTYIVWPGKAKEQPAFWKRLSRSILARRQISQDNVSLA